ncbi:DUF4351 domain-containing protein [Leptolyngbya sp. AN03gr2]|uniref:DUF4351 domain-containing protein n=1 Tax=unclassified Leptolyngbya TaxID=2650499 RepID=UPI003D31B33F
MTRTHHDQFAKQCLAGFLAPYGETEISREVVSEVRQIDVYFVPRSTARVLKSELGLLGQMVTTPSLLEAFRNPVQATHILDCQSKLNDARNELMRRAKSQKQSFTKRKFPQLWVITPSISKILLSGFAGKSRPGWSRGVYFLPGEQRVGIVAINQLPKIASTLWLRLMGRESVQTEAVAELLALPPEYPFRRHALEQLANLRVTIQARQNLSRDDRGLIMTLSPAYEQWQAETLEQGWKAGEQVGRQQGQLDLVMRLLARKVGHIDDALRSQIEQLSPAQLESLGEALLDFSTVDDLSAWLNDHSRQN